MSTADRAEEPRRRSAWPIRVLLFAGMLVCAVNLWTGGPLLAVWVGSKAQASSGQPSMGAIALVALVLIVVELLLARMLGVLTARYDDATGYKRPKRQVPWMKAMTGERDGFGGTARRISPSERMLAAIVFLAVAGFEAWFFFFAGSSIGQ